MLRAAQKEKMREEVRAGFEEMRRAQDDKIHDLQKRNDDIAAEMADTKKCYVKAEADAADLKRFQEALVERLGKVSSMTSTARQTIRNAHQVEEGGEASKEELQRLRLQLDQLRHDVGPVIKQYEDAAELERKKVRFA